MAEYEILSLSHEELSRMFQSGEAKLLKNSTPKAESGLSEIVSEEEAKKILGKDFLGTKALNTMMERLNNGEKVKMRFNTEEAALPYTREEVEEVKRRGEMIILRPKSITTFGGLKKKTSAIKLETLKHHFKEDLYPQDWYEKEKFNFDEEITSGWVRVSKAPLEDSFNKTWDEQEEILKKNGATRRKAVDAVFDEMVYHIVNDERLLPDKWDWTSSETSDGCRVGVGGFIQKGLNVYLWHPEESDPNVGVVSQR